MSYFRPDGTAKGIAFSPESGKRPPSLHVVVVQGKGRRATSLTLANSDFTTQYTRAVDTLLEWLGQFENEELRQQMLAAQPAFLERYKLGLRTATMQVLSTVDGKPVCT